MMKKINNIVLATDFSVTSRNAYKYAKALAHSLNANLTIIHVKEILFMVSDVMITPFPPEHNAELIKNVEEFMAEENETLDTSIVADHVKIEIVTGDPVDVLTERSKHSDIDLMVMGTTGLSDMITKIVGSISHKVSNKSHCPVMLVPRQAIWQPIKQILFASNYDSISSEFVKNISDFANNLSADMHFVNVKNFDPLLENKQKNTDWDELSVVDINLVFKKHIIYGNDTIEQLTKYSEEKSIDLIAFVSKHRNFWENLVHKSITEGMALSTIKPLLVMHLDDK